MNLLEQAKHIPHGVEVIAKWLGSGGSVVDAETSQRRADICIPCPNNVDGMMVVEAVALATKKFLSVKNAMKLHVNGEKKLGRCKLCGCVLRLQVHEPQEKVEAEVTDEEAKLLPDFCWKKKR